MTGARYNPYLAIFVLALVARSLFLIYNATLPLEPYWPWMARWGLTAALSDFGSARDFDYGAYHFSREEVIQGWECSDRGIV